MDYPTKMYRLVNKIRRNLNRDISSSGRSIRVSSLQPLLLQYVDNPIMTGGFSLSSDNIRHQEVNLSENIPSLSFIIHPKVDFNIQKLPLQIQGIVEKDKSEKELTCFIFTNIKLRQCERRAYYLKELLSICSTYISNDFLDTPIYRREYYCSDKTSHKSDFPEYYDSEILFGDKKCQKNDFKCIFEECPQRALWFVAGELLLPFEARCKAIIEKQMARELEKKAEIPYELIECLISEPYMDFSAQMLKLNREKIEQSFRLESIERLFCLGSGASQEINHIHKDIAS